MSARLPRVLATVRASALAAAVGLLFTGCVGAAPTAVPSAPRSPDASPVSEQPSASGELTGAAAAVQGLTWAAETDAGWVAGVVGGPTRTVQTTGHTTAVARGPGQVVFVYAAERGVPIVLSSLAPASGKQTELLHLADSEVTLRVVAPESGNVAYVHSSGDLRDSGVRRLDLTTNEETAVILGGPTPEDTQRADLALSPDEQTLASALCDLATCTIDVVQLASGTSTRIEDRQIHALSDNWLLLSKGDGLGLMLRRLDSGEERELARWEVSARNPDGASVDSVTTLSGDRFVLARTSYGHYDLTLVDASAGTEKLLWRDPKPGDVPALSPVQSMKPVGDWVWLADANGVRPGGTVHAIDVTDGSIELAGTWSAIVQ